MKLESEASRFRALVIGDPHATIDEIPDCQRLVDRILEVVNGGEAPDLLVFLGDQHHNHAVVRVEVIDFWRRAYWRIRDALRRHKPDAYIMCLVGNHDRPGDSSSDAHAMQAYEDLVSPVTQHVRLGGVLWLSYYHDPEEFVKACNLYPQCKTVVCHQTFDGSKYENGFYAKDGISVDRIPQQHIISGHIHTPQLFSKVWYPGAPRWRTSSDANSDRAVWVMDFADGIVFDSRAYTTRGFCRALYEFEDHEGTPLELPADLVPPHLITVGIHGSADYIALRKPFWQAQGARIRTFTTQTHVPRVRESEGISKALQKFVEAYKPKHGTPSERLLKLVSERIHV